MDVEIFSKFRFVVTVVAEKYGRKMATGEPGNLQRLPIEACGEASQIIGKRIGSKVSFKVGRKQSETLD